MKTVAKIFLTLWICFLSAPTVISLVSDTDSTAVSYSICEEEKETKSKFSEESLKEYILNTNQTNLSIWATAKKNLKYNHNEEILTVFEEIFSPPPESINIQA